MNDIGWGLVHLISIIFTITIIVNDMSAMIITIVLSSTLSLSYVYLCTLPVCLSLTHCLPVSCFDVRALVNIDTADATAPNRRQDIRCANNDLSTQNRYADSSCICIHYENPFMEL